MLFILGLIITFFMIIGFFIIIVAIVSLFVKKPVTEETVKYEEDGVIKEKTVKIPSCYRCKHKALTLGMKARCMHPHSEFYRRKITADYDQKTAKICNFMRILPNK